MRTPIIASRLTRRSKKGWVKVSFKKFDCIPEPGQLFLLLDGDQVAHCVVREVAKRQRTVLLATVEQPDLLPQ